MIRNAQPVLFISVILILFYFYSFVNAIFLWCLLFGVFLRPQQSIMVYNIVVTGVSWYTIFY